MNTSMNTSKINVKKQIILAMILITCGMLAELAIANAASLLNLIK